MLKIQIDWIPLVVSVVVPFVFSVYFFFVHLQQRKRINQLGGGWITLKKLGRKEDLKKHIEYIARLSLFMSIILSLFSLVMAGKLLKLF